MLTKYVCDSRSQFDAHVLNINPRRGRAVVLLVLITGVLCGLVCVATMSEEASRKALNLFTKPNKKCAFASIKQNLNLRSSFFPGFDRFDQLEWIFVRDLRLWLWRRGPLSNHTGLPRSSENALQLQS